MKYPYELMEDLRELAWFNFCAGTVYTDLLSCQKGEMTETEFRSRYLTEAAILCLDMTGFTRSAIKLGEMSSFYRVLNVQKVCGPIFYEHNARMIRAFADDFVVLFDDPNEALNTAFEVHRRIRIFNQSELAGHEPAQCCIGIGYAEVFTIGIDQAMGDEMNRASKLGEDVARGFETLVTERLYEAVNSRDDCEFKHRIHEDIVFPFFEVTNDS